MFSNMIRKGFQNFNTFKMEKSKITVFAESGQIQE